MIQEESQTNQEDIQAKKLCAFSRIHFPKLHLNPKKILEHLRRCANLYNEKAQANGLPSRGIFEGLVLLDWYLAIGCLENHQEAWETLFQSHAGRQDFLLIDALRQRAQALFPGDSPRQEESVAEFWGFLLTGENSDSVPVLAKYDGRRPLVPWLIRVFHNLHLTRLRRKKHSKSLAEDEPDNNSYWHAPEVSDERWHQEFRLAAQEWLEGVSDQEILLLGLRIRYKLTQRETASFLGIHESNVSRLTDKVREKFHHWIEPRLREVGWNGDNLASFVQTEMESLVIDSPRLSSNQLAVLISKKGLGKLPQ